jgi:CRISPR-associated protein Cmr3
MSGQWVFIQPQDVWMFRDSKPFSAQQNFVARSQFPPNPQTMQGVIRTYYLESQGVNWKAYAEGRERPEIYETVGHGGFGGQPPALGALRIAGPFIAAENGTKVEFLVSAPPDLVFDAEKQEFGTLYPDKPADFQTNHPFPDWRPLVLPEKSKLEKFKPAAGWLSQSQFVGYLSGQPIQGELRKTVYEEEDRMGLGMDHRRRSNEYGLLYRARFVRPHSDIGLLVYVNQPLLPAAGFFRIGGESRSAKFTVLNNFTMPAAPRTNRLKIVLLTPAYFSGGWYPVGDSWSRWIQGGKLVSAVIGKPLAISGWDVAHNRSKPLRHFVPAGSIYYFENAEITGEPFTETPQGQYPEADFDAMGFGSFAVGTW